MKDAYNERQQELDNFTRELPALDGQCGLLAVIGDHVEGIDLLSRPEAYSRCHHRPTACLRFEMRAFAKK